MTIFGSPTYFFFHTLGLFKLREQSFAFLLKLFGQMLGNIVRFLIDRLSFFIIFFEIKAQYLDLNFDVPDLLPFHRTRLRSESIQCWIRMLRKFLVHTFLVLTACTVSSTWNSASIPHQLFIHGYAIIWNIHTLNTSKK